MEKETIIRLCKENGMDKFDTFVKFFMTRFPNISEKAEKYCIQWIERFNTGFPEPYMDTTSYKIYKSIL